MYTLNSNILYLKFYLNIFLNLINFNLILCTEIPPELHAELFKNLTTPIILPPWETHHDIDNRFFFDWGKTRVNLTKYLIDYNKNNSHWSKIISIDEPEDQAVFERYHNKQGDEFQDEMIKELDSIVEHGFPLKFQIVYNITAHIKDNVQRGFERMMRVRNLIVNEFEEFAERRILKLPIVQKRYFRSLFFYNCNLENVRELRSYIRSYFQIEDDIDEDMKIQARSLRKIQSSILDSLHNQFYLDVQKELEKRYLENEHINFTRKIVEDHKTTYVNIL